jgi:hypothetical protein
MKIKLEKLKGWQRWPVNSTRFLLPSIAVQGFRGSNIRVIFVFWKWRQDILFSPNDSRQGRREETI